MASETSLQQFPEGIVPLPEWVLPLDNMLVTTFIHSVTEVATLNANQQNVMFLFARINELYMSAHAIKDKHLVAGAEQKYGDFMATFITDPQTGIITTINNYINVMTETDFNKLMLRDRLKKDSLSAEKEMQERYLLSTANWSALRQFIDSEKSSIVLMFQMPWLVSKLNAVSEENWQALGQKYFTNSLKGSDERGLQLFKFISQDYGSYKYPSPKLLENLLPIRTSSRKHRSSKA